MATDLSLVYPNGNGGLQALDRVTFSAQRNEFLCVVGASGSGKTTLLRLLGGLLNPTEGEVQFEGERMIGPRRRIGFVFQAANLMPWRSALENVKLPLELQGTNSGANSRRAAELLKLVGLVDFENTLPRDLSGGMAQRVAIARALVHEPDLLLLDEPFGSLDALTRERMIFELLRIWQMRKVTILMVTHSIWEAVLMADRVLVLSQRPGSIRLDLEMPLSRPRSLDMMHTPEFGKLVDQVRSAIE
ncbi:MAG: ABC transporter ATP-binding protein [Chloroflexi bacterium]|nr:ABC transporter ATP-binding protein [Chloroflexota bacterium]